MSTFHDTFLAKLAPWQRTMLDRLLKLKAEGKSLVIPLHLPRPMRYVMGFNPGVPGDDFSCATLMERKPDGTVHVLASERARREPKSDIRGRTAHMIILDEVGHWP